MATSELKVVVPIQYCGLDPLFSACPKLFICDILNIPEIHSGVFQYRAHLVVTVDVVGVIVKKFVKDKVIIYAVDDGTGVISCSCWRTPYNDPKLSSLDKLTTAFRDQSLRSKVKQLQRSKQQIADGFAIGSLLHVQGNVSTYCEVREIKAFYIAIVDDPNIEASWMLKQVDLYQRFYDRPLLLPSAVVHEIDHGGMPLDTQKVEMRSLTEAILHHIQQNHLETVRVNILSAVHKFPQSAEVLRQALLELDAKGYLCRHGTNIGEFIVLKHDKQIFVAIFEIIQSSSNSTGEDGCHFLLIYSKIRQLLRYARLCKAALQRCLITLETHSCITLISDKHYVAVSDADIGDCCTEFDLSF